MASTAIFHVQYAYSAEVVRKRHRNPEVVLLRGTRPVEILELAPAEAPVRLTATLSKSGQRPTRIELRHDGTSYLRPIGCSTGRDGRTTHPFAREQFAAMLALDGFDPPDSIDAPRAILTRDNARLLPRTRDPWGDRRVAEELPTAETIEAREWLWSGSAEAERKVLAEAEGYVFVGDVLHRRTRAPILAWEHFEALKAGSDYPPRPLLLDHADLDRTDGGSARSWRLWPISCAGGFLAMAPGGGWKLKVDAPLETDHAPGLEIALRAALSRVDERVNEVVRYLSDEGLDAYRDYRRHHAAAFADGGGLAELQAAMEAVRRLSRDPGFDPSAATWLPPLRNTAADDLAHWDAMAHQAGLAMDRRDEEAVAALAL